MATIYPPIGIFDEVADAEDLNALLALRARTDPLLGDGLERALAIPAKDRAYGPGAGYIMAPFAHPSPAGTRFGPPAFAEPSFGVYNAARDEATSIAEVRHHRTAFLAATRAVAQDLDFEVIAAPIKGSRFYDLRDRKEEFAEIYSRTDYSSSQRFAVRARGENVDGIAYDSVRREGGECLAVFRPRCVGPAKVVKNLIFRWDGEEISAVLETHSLG